MDAAAHRRRSERAIVLQLLRDDRGDWWTCGELCAELRITRNALTDSLRDLEQEGVVVIGDGDRVIASRCTRHLDMLELIGL